MAKTPQLLDQYGRPVERHSLTEEIAAPTFGGVRSPITGYPADGLTPLRLGQILREADAGDPVRYLELAEAIEERDLHYVGVLGTRRRSVSQLDITVKPGDDSPQAERIAQRIRDWLTRDELSDELFDTLDCIGKGYSMTEIIWDRSSAQWEPARLEWRDPRWFTFDPLDLTTPLQLDENGQRQPLKPFKFVYARIKAKSGLPLRSGLARIALWAYLFKKYTERDWAIFSQTYGQPLRVGKYGPGTSKEDREKLFQAVANIAGDCAAIVPEGMMIEFIETGNLGAAVSLYEKRADWYDKQMSKAVLGQTATTDAVTGGLGSGKEHREVQEDIERADAKSLQAILNRDLIRPWVQLEFGPQKTYPRLIIARPEDEDLKAFADGLTPFVQLGLPVKQSEIHAKFGLSQPGENDEIIGGSAQTPPDRENDTVPSPSKSPLNTHLTGQERDDEDQGTDAALQAETAAVARSGEPDPVETLAARLEVEAAPAMTAMISRIEAMVNAAGSLEELRENLLAGFPDLDHQKLAAVLAMASMASHAGGRAVQEDESA
ncbi:Mu-like prophage protein gp29 [Thalassovita gelatinovora]|uniref:Mu-like prophage protein gp29 n=1 Tax=Thalassovita gelatinovora TaxID=53501 RepID=A0A0P1G548_THAGE|nr:DUF935 domain-containing protein [Thalassovita gelatinovora]QIZ81570.1 DUF935 domain-containing protein [Thalassovita gelatinovora]CUH67991.1 Mu-like prophage protein gp29 [Thalassovita gelatinovora]SEQ26991.1 Mu-like prophage protein gp29 [Thalassovita gelatinovora]